MKIWRLDVFSSDGSVTCLFRGFFFSVRGEDLKFIPLVRLFQFLYIAERFHLTVFWFLQLWLQFCFLFFLQYPVTDLFFLDCTLCL